MATKLTRPVTRETYATFLHYRRPIIVTLEGALIRLREKGRRTSYSIDVATVYQTACFMARKAAKDAKRRERKTRGNRR